MGITHYGHCAFWALRIMGFAHYGHCALRATNRFLLMQTYFLLKILSSEAIFFSRSTRKIFSTAVPPPVRQALLWESPDFLVALKQLYKSARRSVSWYISARNAFNLRPARCELWPCILHFTKWKHQAQICWTWTAKHGNLTYLNIAMMSPLRKKEGEREERKTASID